MFVRISIMFVPICNRLRAREVNIGKNLGHPAFDILVCRFR